MQRRADRQQEKIKNVKVFLKPTFSQHFCGCHTASSGPLEDNSRSKLPHPHREFIVSGIHSNNMHMDDIDDMKLHRTLRVAGWLFLAAVLPFLAYYIGYNATYLGKLENLGIYLLLSIFLIIGLLAVPYWMLKLSSRAEKEINPKARELRLKDIPKDIDQLHGHSG
jgi:hypothetical protein